MFRTAFNEPIPANAAELDEVIGDFDLDTDNSYARIEFNDPDDGGLELYHGFTAEIVGPSFPDEDDEVQDIIVMTGGFATREELVAVLEGAGIDDVEDM